MNKIITKLFKFFVLIILLFTTTFNKAEEILIYADSISYDENENIIAKGKAKVFQNNKLIISELIIYNKLEEKIILPSNFVFKDEKNNFLINKNFNEDKKLLLIEALWEIVLSDGEIHDFESNLIRRLAGLLYISDVDSGNARKRDLDKKQK